MDEVISLLINNGAALGCLLYFMYNQNTSQKELTKAINELHELIKELLIRLEGKNENI